MTAGLATSSPTTTWPLEACPDCDYALSGLPAEGVCPECGRAYDRETVVLYGRAGGTHANLLNTRTRSFVGKCVWISVILLLMGWIGRSTRWWIVATVAALAYVAAAFQQRCSGRRGGMAQARLNAAGCLQDDNPDDGPNTGPLRMFAEVFLAMLPSSFAMFNGLNGAFFVYFWPAMVIVAVALRLLVPLPAARRLRRMVAALPGGPALIPAWRGWWTPVPVPWSLIREARVEPLAKPTDEATDELVIQTVLRGWRGMDREPVHLLIRRTPEQAAELRRRIAEWREAGEEADPLAEVQ